MEKELKNTSTSQLKDKIIATVQEQMENIGYISVFKLYQEFLQLRNEFKSKRQIIEKIGGEEKEILNLYDKVKNSLDNLDIFLDSKDLGVDCFIGLRNEIIDLLSVLSSYLTEISYSNEIANDFIMRNEFKKNELKNMKNINFEKFYKDVYNFLVKDMNNLFDKILKIISVIPMRISKQVYYDSVKRALMSELAKYSEEKVDMLIKRYKSIFNGALDAQYGQKFDRYFRFAQQNRMFDFKKATIEDIKKLYNENLEHTPEIYTLLELLRKSGLIVNKLIVIQKTKKHIKNITNNKSIEELVEKWKLLNDNHSEDLEKLILHICEENLEEIIERSNKNNSYFDKLTNVYKNKNGDIDDELNQLLFELQYILAYFNDNYLEREELLVFKIEELVSQEYLKQAVNNFIQFIDRNIKEMSNLQRKVRMKRILTTVPGVFARPDEFFYYLKNSMELNTSREDMMYDLNKVAVIIEEYDKI